jgi:hypothetical protein
MNNEPSGVKPHPAVEAFRAFADAVEHGRFTEADRHRRNLVKLGYIVMWKPPQNLGSTRNPKPRPLLKGGLG